MKTIPSFLNVCPKWTIVELSFNPLIFIILVVIIGSNEVFTQRQASNINIQPQQSQTDQNSITSQQSVNSNEPIKFDWTNYGIQNLSRKPPELSTDWLMLGGSNSLAGDELLIDTEAKNMATFVAFPNSNGTTKRTGTSSKRRTSLSNNRTRQQFDDEQSTDSTDSNEIFDDPEDVSMAGVQKEPDCASHRRYYCTYKEDYPLKLVTEVTKYYKWPLEKLFRDLHAQIMPKLAQDTSHNLVCDSITRVVRPGWARNTNDRWLVVINTENYHQYVTEVVCQYGSNSRCNYIPPCYYSSCQQRYNTQKLLVIDPSNPYRGPFLSEFLFPSCCVCYVPTTSDSLNDKYRPSPASIYQRTMQQDASMNINPINSWDSEQGSSSAYSSSSSQVSNNDANSHTVSSNGAIQKVSASKQTLKSNQPIGPGEIGRRSGQLESQPFASRRDSLANTKLR